MEKIWLVALSFILGTACLNSAEPEKSAAKPAESAAQTAKSAAQPAKSAAELEKEKAQKNPYPNDFGHDKTDVSKYNLEEQQGYKLMQEKCARCHTPSRPLNSQFLQLKADEQAQVKASNPEVFKDKLVWQVEDAIWQRYIKRMMSKPGCAINDADGRKIFKFMVEYSKRTKTGANAKLWADHRKKLLADFKLKYPARHKELFETP